MMPVCLFAMDELLKIENMFEQETITRRCVLTLQDGAKIHAMLTMPKPKKAMFLEVMEQNFVDKLNKEQPNLKNKVVKCHIMRN